MEMQGLDTMLVWRRLVPKMLVKRRGSLRKENRKHADAAILCWHRMGLLPKTSGKWYRKPTRWSLKMWQRGPHLVKFTSLEHQWQTGSSENWYGRLSVLPRGQVPHLIMAVRSLEKKNKKRSWGLDTKIKWKRAGTTYSRLLAVS